VELPNDGSNIGTLKTFNDICVTSVHLLVPIGRHKAYMAQGFGHKSGNTFDTLGHTQSGQRSPNAKQTGDKMVRKSGVRDTSALVVVSWPYLWSHGHIERLRYRDGTANHHPPLILQRIEKK
jgi:hypothetical protein